MGFLKRMVHAADQWQRRNRIAAPAYGVVKKFSDDQANLLVVALGWYGFTAIYPLMLVVITVFGFIGIGSLGSGLVRTLHQFPVIGQQFTPGQGGKELHGSVTGLVIGVVGLFYGAQGVTQIAESAMSQVWNVPRFERPGFKDRLGRSVGGLAVIGIAFLVNAAVAGIATSSGRSYALRIPVLAALLLVNAAFYFGAFRILTPKEVESRALFPGSVLGAVSFTLLITVGTGLVEHQLRNESATYGAFASVIGVVAFLLLLAKLSVYAAELNPVLARRLFPRSLTGEQTDGDRQVYHDLAHEQRRNEEMRVGVGFGSGSVEQAHADARQQDDDHRIQSDDQQSGGPKPS